MSKLRLGVLGCGQIVRDVHLNVLTGLPGTEVVAVSDSDTARLRSAANRAPGVDTFSDYRELLVESDADAVVIALPTALHGEAARAAFEAGKHVYLEKPLAAGLAQADGVMAAWHASGKVGVIGFNYRFHPLYRKLRDQLRSRRIGDLVAVRTTFCCPTRDLPEWKRSRETGGGALLDLASHHVDLVRFLFEEAMSDVHAEIRSVRTEADTAALRLTLATGLSVQSLFCLAAVDEDRFEIYGTGGKLFVDRYRSLDVEFVDPAHGLFRPTRWADSIKRAVGSGYALRKIASRGAESSYRAALESFVAAVRGESSESPDLEDGYNSLAIIEAAETSARTGTTIRLGDREGRS